MANITLPKRITALGIDRNAWLRVVDRKGAYVTLFLRRSGPPLYLSEEGNGTPESVKRIVETARRNGRAYVIDRILTAARFDRDFRERLKLVDIYA